MYACNKPKHVNSAFVCMQGTVTTEDYDSRAVCTILDTENEQIPSRTKTMDDDHYDVIISQLNIQ